jgi:hypothetical protein
MDALATHVVTAVLSLAVGLALRVLEPKVRIVWWGAHQFLFQVPTLIPDGPPQQVHLLTHALTIQNLGRKEAEWVEIVHRARPDFFKLQPPSIMQSPRRHLVSTSSALSHSAPRRCLPSNS